MYYDVSRCSSKDSHHLSSHGVICKSKLVAILLICLSVSFAFMVDFAAFTDGHVDKAKAQSWPLSGVWAATGLHNGYQKRAHTSPDLQTCAFE